ncbi:MAG TPA: YkgJ family cysteine cluster protein, partial [Anaerolineae bacterium]|nr:YkgJ family cysteine cluster protein [Anaerolineae bacterium]
PRRRPKSKSVARELKRPRQEDEASSQTNLRRITTKGWAITAQVLGQRPTLEGILDLMGFYDWLGDQNLEAIVQRMPRLPCRSGCAYCCYVSLDRPDLLPPEVHRIASYIRDQGEAALQRLSARIAERRAGAQDLPEEERAKLPCLFLEQERCLVYLVRPLRCRAQHSPDAEACKQHYLAQRETMPLIAEPALLYKALQTGLQLGLRELRLQSERLRLLPAVEAALAYPQALDGWLRGEPVFAGVEYPDDTDEVRFLRRFARQAKQQVQSEKQQLQRLLGTFAEHPGAWAAYSLSGASPLSAIAGLGAKA